VRSRLRLQVAFCLGVLCGLRCHGPIPSVGPHTVHPLIALDTNADSFRRTDPKDRLASSDPLGFLKMCRDHYEAAVRDYRCHFHFRERRNGELRKEEVMAVRFREKPYSVDMHWIQNANQAHRVNYVAGRWNKDGRELALIEPSGLLGLFTPGGIRLDIHGPEVRSASPRSVDEFGFKNTLDRIIEECERARHDPRYGLRRVADVRLDGRRCFVFERRLPYTPGDEAFPDRLLLIYIDREWRVPTGCLAYADDAGEVLLGSYLTTAVEFNVGLTDADF